MLNFWVRYVKIKQAKGIAVEVTLNKIERKYGEEYRNKIEKML